METVIQTDSVLWGRCNGHFVCIKKGIHETNNSSWIVKQDMEHNKYKSIDHTLKKGKADVNKLQQFTEMTLHGFGNLLNLSQH